MRFGFSSPEKAEVVLKIMGDLFEENQEALLNLDPLPEWLTRSVNTFIIMGRSRPREMRDSEADDELNSALVESGEKDR